METGDVLGLFFTRASNLVLASFCGAMCWPGLISIRITPTWTRFQTRKARSRFLQICSFPWQTFFKSIWLNAVCGFCFILMFSIHFSSFSVVKSLEKMCESDLVICNVIMNFRPSFLHLCLHQTPFCGC